MSKFIRRLLKLFRVYYVTYTGPGISLNDFYAGGVGKTAWRVRSGIKAKYSKIFGYLLNAANLPQFSKYALVVFFNSRHDTGNVSGMEKVFIDTFKKKYVKDDSKQYNEFVAFCYDPSLPMNTFQFAIIKL